MLDTESLLIYLGFMAEEMESYDTPLNDAKASTYRAVIKDIESGRHDYDRDDLDEALNE